MVNEYNEISYAEEMIKNGFLSNRHIYELAILAKYYYFKGFSKDNTKKNILSFCKDNIENFTEVKYFDKINSVLDSSQKNPIIELGGVQIKDSDIEFINEFELNKFEKQVLFGFVLIKRIRDLLGQPSYLNYKYSKFTKLCGLSKPVTLYPIIYKLSTLGLIRVCRNSNCEILFELTDGSTVFIVNDIDRAFGYYKNYIGDGHYKECSRCGKIIRYNSNKKYCNDCAKIVNIEQTLIRKNKKV